MKRHDPLLKLQFLASFAQIQGMSGVASRVAILLTNAYNFEKDKCWWSIKTIAKAVKSSEKQVSTAIKYFKEHHIFFIKSGRTGKSNEYKPNFNLILKYPAYTSEETLQKIRKKTTDQTIKENNKLNTFKENKSWGRKLVDPLSFFSNKPDGLEKYVFAVKKGVRIQRITDDMVKEMYRRGLINEEDYKGW